MGGVGPSFARGSWRQDGTASLPFPARPRKGGDDTTPRIRRSEWAGCLTMQHAWRLRGSWRWEGADEAWSRGVILCGVSAGAICWFQSGVTDSLGTSLQPLHSALGLIDSSFCPHYDGEAARRPAFHRFLEAGDLPDGYAADDGAALLF